MKKISNKNEIFLILILAFILIVNLFGEKLSYEHWKTWDAGGYTERTINFDRMIINKEINRYYIQRILTQALVWASAKILNKEITIEYVEKAFLFINIICIIFSLLIWYRIYRLVNLDSYQRLLGIILLFYTFPILKQSMYYPILNDMPAFLIGMGMLYYYLKNSIIRLIILSVIGSFVFPTLIYQGIILIIFNRKNNINYEEIYEISKKRILIIISFLFVFLYLTFIYKIFRFNPSIIESYNHSSMQYSPIIVSFFNFSVFTVCLFIYFVTFILLRSDMYLKKLILEMFSKHRIVLIIFSLLLIFLVKSIQNVLSGSDSPYSFFWYLIDIVRHSIAAPIKFLVSHFVYYGVSIVLLIIFFPKISESNLKFGYGFTILILIFLINLINSESREYINFYPFLVFSLVAALKLHLDKEKILIIFIFNLILSKFWYIINTTEFYGRFTEFPWQNYFMNHGPWMSSEMYFLYLSLFILLVIVISYIFKCKSPFYNIINNKNV